VSAQDAPPQGGVPGAVPGAAGVVEAHLAVPMPVGTVALIGTNALVLEALASGLVPAPELALAGTFRSALALARRLGGGLVDLVVVEVSPRDDEDALGAIRDHLGPVRLVLLADTAQPYVRAVLDGHADGLVLTSSSTRQVVEALVRVLAGAVVLPDGWRAIEPDDPVPAELAGLSGRQTQILELLAAGLSNDDIAARLAVSVNTVKYHVRALYARLGIHNRVQAARLLADARSRT
jgi:DNA-binding NarL/FixJ family response regulator